MRVQPQYPLTASQYHAVPKRFNRTLALRAGIMLFNLKARNRHAELVRSMGTSQLMCCGRELHIRLYAYGPIEACKVPTVLSGSRPHRSGASRQYAHPTPDLVRAVSCPEGGLAVPRTARGPGPPGRR